MTRPLVLLLCLAPLLGGLGGCAGAVVAGAGAGVAVAKDPRPARQVLADQALKLKALDTVYGDPALAKRVHVNVEVYMGTVLLTGEALGSMERRRVVEKVRRLEGVRRVIDDLVVADLTPFKSRSRDAWITSKVKARLVSAAGLAGVFVKVHTERGIVYLMGLVTRSQGAEAARIASRVEGVRKVVKLFQYRDARA